MSGYLYLTVLSHYKIKPYGISYPDFYNVYTRVCDAFGWYRMHYNTFEKMITKDSIFMVKRDNKPDNILLKRSNVTQPLIRLRHRITKGYIPEIWIDKREAHKTTGG
jgi:hypothetical protein